MTVKELIDKLQQFDEDKLVLVEDTEYKEFQAIDVEPVLQWAINGLKKK